jgi:hypothetical protein
MFIPVQLEKSLSIANSKVFKVQQAVWLILADQLDKPMRALQAYEVGPTKRYVELTCR